MHRSLSELAPMFDDSRYNRLMLLGGDLNTWTGWKAGLHLERDRVVRAHPCLRSGGLPGGEATAGPTEGLSVQPWGGMHTYPDPRGPSLSRGPVSDGLPVRLACIGGALGDLRSAVTRRASFAQRPLSYRGDVRPLETLPPLNRAEVRLTLRERQSVRPPRGCADHYRRERGAFALTRS